MLPEYQTKTLHMGSYPPIPGFPPSTACMLRNPIVSPAIISAISVLARESKALRPQVIFEVERSSGLCGMILPYWLSGGGSGLLSPVQGATSLRRLLAGDLHLYYYVRNDKESTYRTCFHSPVSVPLTIRWPTVECAAVMEMRLLIPTTAMRYFIIVN